jgi:hypothetical protein
MEGKLAPGDKAACVTHAGGTCPSVRVHKTRHDNGREDQEYGQDYNAIYHCDARNESPHISPKYFTFEQSTARAKYPELGRVGTIYISLNFKALLNNPAEAFYPANMW